MTIRDCQIKAASEIGMPKSEIADRMKFATAMFPEAATILSREVEAKHVLGFVTWFKAIFTNDQKFLSQIRKKSPDYIPHKRN